MKKILLILIMGMVVIGSLFTVQVSAQTPADNTYTVLAPLPGTTLSDCPQGSTDCKTTLEKYLPGVFKLAIGLSAVAAVLMIVIGGFQYISSDAIMKKSEGKERIKNAVFGLVLVISAWLILNTINPNLLNINLNIEPVTTTSPAGGGGTLNTSGVQPAMEYAYVDLAAKCTGCTIRITSTTGGTHDVNSAHYQGLAVDIAPNAQLTNYLTGSTNNPPACQIVSKTLAGKSSRFLWEPTGSKCGGTAASTGDHWHMSVTP